MTISLARDRVEAGASGLRLAAFDRTVLGDPLGQAAVEDGDAVGAEMAKHEPAARRAAQRTVVVDDDAVVAADAEVAHGRAEFGRRGEHVRHRVRLVRQRLDVEEARAGDVPGLKLGCRVAAVGGHEHACIDDDEVGLAEMLVEPGGRNQVVHVQPLPR